MPDVHTQTLMTGNRIETVWKEHGALKNAKWQRTYKKKKRATKRIVDQVGKRMAEHIVEAVQKTVRQARKKTVRLWSSHRPRDLAGQPEEDSVGGQRGEQQQQ